MEKIRLKEAIIVEGKYDKNTVSQIVDTLIIETNGFSIFNNAEIRNYIKKISEERGIIILTDSDSAGFLIRNKIKDFVEDKYIKNVFIPQISGKEKRKKKYSKDGYIGVEGTECEILRQLLIKTAQTVEKETNRTITYSDLYELGYIGKENSKKNKSELLKKFKLPSYINNSDLLKYINNNISLFQFITDELDKKNSSDN